MKAFKLLLWLCPCLFLMGCTGDEVRDFMPGSYVNSAGGEYSVASDTLTVELVEGNNYRVFRRTGYNLIRDGKLGTREFATEVWTCAYSSASKNLMELRKGKVVTFFPKENELRVGARVYKKIN